MIDTRTVSPGTRPWLVENSTLIFAIAEYVIVAPVPISVVVGELNDTALKNTMVSSIREMIYMHPMEKTLSRVVRLDSVEI